MCQEPTELLWIGCSTGLIWTPRFRFVTLTPNINSQTCWPKVISHGMNGTISFICWTSAISALLAALRIPEIDKLLQKDGEEDAGTKRRSKNCGKIQNYSNELVFFYSDKFILRNKSDCIQKSEDIDSFGETENRMRINSKSDAASSSQVRLQDAYLGGLMDTAAVKPVASEEESGDMDLSESETGSLHEEEVTGRLVARKTAEEKPNASSKSDHALGRSTAPYCK